MNYTENIVISHGLDTVLFHTLDAFWIAGIGGAPVFNKSQVITGDTRHCNLCWVYGDCNDDVSN
jgi:hypothetical protein